LKDKAERLEAFAGKLGGVQSRIRDFEESRPALKLADAWGAFLKSPNRKDTAGAARLRICEGWANRLVSFMAKHYADITEIRGIGKEQAHRFAAEGFSDVGNSTRNQAISFYRMMWRVLIADGAARITCNPWDGIQKKHETHTRRREMTVEELVRVYALLEGEMRLLFSVGIYTGQRLGDCALLEWGQVDLIRRHIALIPRKTARKTGRTVIIPIHANLLKMLLEFPAAARVGYVMPQCAKMYKEQASELSERFKRVFKAAGIETATDGADGHRKRALVSFHSLRHTFVSLAANAGVPLAVVQSIVGHSTVDMTRHYFHESENALVSAVAALPSVTDGETDAGGGMSARLRSVCALADELTAEERAALLRHLQGAADRKPDAAAVECVPMLENKGAQVAAQGKPDAAAA
jgi:integrase